MEFFQDHQNPTTFQAELRTLPSRPAPWSIAIRWKSGNCCSMAMAFQVKATPFSRKSTMKCGQKLKRSSLAMKCLDISTGWWFSFNPSEKWWTSSVGMMFQFPIWWESHISHVPNLRSGKRIRMSWVPPKNSGIWMYPLVMSTVSYWKWPLK